MLKRVCYQCSFMCLTDLEFQFAHHMKQHQKNIVDDSNELEKRTCPAGDFETHSQVALHRHVQTSHQTAEENRKSYECSHCDLTTCSQLISLKHHDNKHRNLKLDKTCTVCRAGGSTLWFKCWQCDFTTRYRRSLVKHSLGKHHFTKWHRCSECSYRTKHATTLRQHDRLKHADDAIAWICCSKCSYRTREALNLEKHVRKKHDNNNFRNDVFECDKCSYKAKQKFNLIRHIGAVHVERVEKWYRCGKCSYRAKLRCRLNEHVKTHDKFDAKFKCDQCSYQTDKSSTFKTHRLRHMDPSKVAWFNCSKCSYRSLQKSNLNTHLSKHAQ